MTPLILASGSETRAKLLRNFQIPFEQKTAFFDEDALNYAQPRSFVYHATMGKLEAAKRAFENEGRPILCADTVVAVQEEILRKAKDADDARRILSKQSGSRTDIMTCSVLWKPELLLIDLSVTSYDFAPFDSEAIEHYIESNLWQGKAGACMVEGFCKPYIRQVTGLESCAMGLTVEKLLPFL